MSKSDGRELTARGKSELLRAGCWVTPSKGDLKDSATERYRPVLDILKLFGLIIPNLTISDT